MHKENIFLSRSLLLIISSFIVLLFSFATCKYGFRDAAPIPEEVKTFRINYLENKAQYVNTRLSPQLTERLKDKIRSTTRLKQTNDDDAHYDINGYISQYFTTTVSISGANANANRLTVGFHLNFRNTLDDSKSFEADLTRTYDFPATNSLTEAETSLNEQIVRNMVDEIFNRIFSNW